MFLKQIDRFSLKDVITFIFKKWQIEVMFKTLKVNYFRNYLSIKQCSFKMLVYTTEFINYIIYILNCKS